MGKAASNAEQLLAPGGELSEMLDRLERYVVGPGILPGAQRFTIADVHIFCAFGQWSSGFFKGVTANALLDGRPKLKALIERVGALPKVRACYAKKDFAKSGAIWKRYGEFAKL